MRFEPDVSDARCEGRPIRGGLWTMVRPSIAQANPPTVPERSTQRCPFKKYLSPTAASRTASWEDAASLVFGPESRRGQWSS